MKFVTFSHNKNSLNFLNETFPEYSKEKISNAELRKYMDTKYRGDYLCNKSLIEKEGLRTPAIGELVSLVHSVLMNPESADPQAYKNIVRCGGWLIGFTGILYLPKEGFYIQDCPDVKDDNIIMTRENLLKKLAHKREGIEYSSDESVRFVPIKNISKEKAEKLSINNPYALALIGEEGCNKLEEITKKYSLLGFFSTIKKLGRMDIRGSSLQLYGRGKYWDMYSELIKIKGNDSRLIEKNSVLALQGGSIDSRPFWGAGSAFGINE